MKWIILTIMLLVIYSIAKRYISNDKKKQAANKKGYSDKPKPKILAGSYMHSTKLKVFMTEYVKYHKPI